MRSTVAFFDIDNTILDTSSGKLIIKYSYQNGLIPHSKYIVNMLIAFLHGTGLLNTEYVINKWAMKSKGLPEKMLIDYSKGCFNDVIIHHIRGSAIEEINSLQNVRTVLLSASLSYVCYPIGEYLKIDDILCTELDAQDGLLTGRLMGKYCYGREKLNRVEEFCKTNGFTLDDSSYYADSFADIYVLERVGTPICVTPDKRLRREALKRGWKIYDW
ncbi:MAG: HAD-IB family hydrolase [Spirochaetota bacterium]|nr:HAD-IB family hydrolase [Spirochaetota bacterium]